MRLLTGVLLSLLVIIPAGLRAKPSIASCNGVDLYLTASPEQRKQVDNKAATIINGVGRFWKVEHNGIAPSWLLGTMHTTDPSITKLNTAEIAAFRQSKRLILELKVAGAQTIDAAIKTVIENQPQLAFYQPGESLSHQVEPKIYENYQRSLVNFDYNPMMVQAVKPWIIWASLSFPKCEIDQQQDGAQILDVKLATMANESKKPVLGLETVGEQLTSLAKLPPDIVIDDIISFTKTKDRANNLFYTARNLYLQGKIATIMALSELDAKTTDQRTNKRGETILIDTRNQRMFERAIAYIANGGSFIAVGAAHLPGEHGLIAMLKKAGYKVTVIAH